jgi:tetratricopeptide (TPR) repeat protein
MVVTAVYSNHFYNGFHFDDAHSVLDNPHIRDIKNVPSFFKDGTTSSILPQNQAYRPVVTASLALDYKMGNGYDLFYFHLSTYILFLLQGVLMLLFFNKLLSLSSSNKNIGYVALFATAWYLLHPAIAETVNYIIARSDVQSTLAVVAAFVLYTYSPFCKKTFIYLIPVGIGALAKPTAVMFAPLLFVYILLFEENMSLTDIFKRSGFKPLWNSIKKSLPAFIACALFYMLITKLTPKTWEPGGTSPIDYLITQPYVILHYFLTFFWPTGLSADTDWGILPGIRNFRFFTGCGFILLMLGIAVYTSRSALLRPISFGILWFFLALIPTSSIIPLGEVLNDHRMFFPFVGLVISVSWAIGLAVFKLTGPGHSLTVKYKILILLPALVLLSACAYGTWKRNAVWHSEESLWLNVTVKSPGNGRGLMNYGLIKINESKYAEAEQYLNRALQLLPNYSYIYVNMGVLKERTGDYAGAENYYLQGITLGPGYSTHAYMYGQFLYNQARFVEAQVMLQKAIELSPAYIPPYVILMKTYALLGEWDLLKSLAAGTLKIAPGNPDALAGLEYSSKRKNKAEIAADDIKTAPTAQKYLDLGLDYYWEGKYEKSIEAGREAIKLKPDYADAYNNMGCSYNALDQYDKSIEVFKMALALNPGYQLVKNNMQASEEHKHTSNDIISSKVYTAEDYLNQSLTYFNQRQYELCIAACVSALAINPGYDLAYNNLCAAYNKLGRWDDAIMLGEKGLKINPNNQLLRNNLNEALEGKKNSHKK